MDFDMALMDYAVYENPDESLYSPRTQRVPAHPVQQPQFTELQPFSTAHQPVTGRLLTPTPSTPNPTTLPPLFDDDSKSIDIKSEYTEDTCTQDLPDLPGTPGSVTSGVTMTTAKRGRPQKGRSKRKEPLDPSVRAELRRERRRESNRRAARKCRDSKKSKAEQQVKEREAVTCENAVLKAENEKLRHEVLSLHQQAAYMSQQAPPSSKCCCQSSVGALVVQPLSPPPATPLPAENEEFDFTILQPVQGSIQQSGMQQIAFVEDNILFPLPDIDSQDLNRYLGDY